ncbi:hypothetical protein PPROV_000431600 [Pycnococcus provasolii]|uniref:EF-hand domain-containing protein n=1 Tax=Pycnococcus provasolii TaxID=41880 RepID=A0A830HDT3_9CHLO|nr:hypothetical protein PPROV_000431600 [Pycnococcus provasolii]
MELRGQLYGALPPSSLSPSPPLPFLLSRSLSRGAGAAASPSPSPPPPGIPSLALVPILSSSSLLWPLGHYLFVSGIWVVAAQCTGPGSVSGFAFPAVVMPWGRMPWLSSGGFTGSQDHYLSSHPCRRRHPCFLWCSNGGFKVRISFLLSFFGAVVLAVLPVAVLPVAVAVSANGGGGDDDDGRRRSSSGGGGVPSSSSLEQACSADDDSASPSSSSCAAQADNANNKAASRLFDKLDANDDGQIEINEASSYIRQTMGNHRDFDTDKEVNEAAKRLLDSLDSNDEGGTVSESEMMQHLKGMLNPRDVEEWVRLGLRQPKHAPAFAQNAVTGMDFPYLAANGGAALSDELGVRSPLVRKQFVRALKRRMLRLGSPAGVPVRVSCAPLPTRCAVRLAWNPPTTGMGEPPLHSYEVVGRTVDDGDARGPWEHLGLAPASSADDDDFDYASPSASAVAKDAASANHHSEHHTVVHNATDVIIPPQHPYHAATTTTSSTTPPQSSHQPSVASQSKHDNQILRVRAFQYRVRAWSTFGHGPWSEAVECTPPAAPCRASLAEEMHSSRPKANSSNDGGDIFSPYDQLRSIALALVLGLAIRWGGLLARLVGALLGNDVETARVASPVVQEQLINSSPGRASGDAGMASPSADPANGVGGRSSSVSFAGSTAHTPPRNSSEYRRRASLTRFDSVRLEEARKELLRAESGGALNELDTPVGAPPPPSPPSPHVNVRQRAISHQRSRSSESLQDGESTDDGVLVGDGQVGDGLDYQHDDLDDPMNAANGGDEDRLASRRGRECCRVIGCKVRFDRWWKMKDHRARSRRHFCAVCQMVMCEEHTRISPHGRVGSCGLESQCYCDTCFAGLDAETKRLLDRTDRLKPVRNARMFVEAARKALEATRTANLPTADETESHHRARLRWRGAVRRVANASQTMPPGSGSAPASSMSGD